VITIPFLEEERRWQYSPTRRLGTPAPSSWLGLLGGLDALRWPTLGAILRWRPRRALSGRAAYSSSSTRSGSPSLSRYGLAFNATRGVYERIRPFMGVVNLLSGILIIIAGILIFTERLIDLNQFFQVDFLDFGGNA